MRDFAHSPQARKTGAIRQKRRSLPLRPAIVALLALVALIWLIATAWSGFDRLLSRDAEKGLAENPPTAAQLVATQSPPPASPVDARPSDRERDRRTPKLQQKRQLEEALLPGHSNSDTLSDQQSLPQLPSVTEPFAFYRILSQPLPERELQPEIWQGQRIYRVTSSPLRTREHALSLRAQLFFLGFNKVTIEPRQFNQRPAYNVVVSGIRSRSQMNKARDFFADNDIETSYSYHNRQ